MKCSFWFAGARLIRLGVGCIEVLESGRPLSDSTRVFL